ncbi:MAG: hypothetical protein HQ504_00925 [Rhodospirillaceae bacterium]|nr:hypothetical protein [Rhodospirillaceae bacterium]
MASTPSVGFKLDHHFATGDAIFDALDPILDKWVDGEKQLFTVKKHESFSVSFDTIDGFVYGIEPSKVHISFSHKMKAKPVSGGPPIMEMLSSPLPFTELLPNVSERLSTTTLLLPGASTRNIQRVGIVTSTAVAEDEVPPGIERFIKYIGRPWNSSAECFSFSITTEVNSTSDWSDRCIHTLVKLEEPEELLTIVFDWQRKFTSGRPITSNSLKEILVKAEKDSLDYFEDVAEGSRFDEDIINSTT